MKTQIKPIYKWIFLILMFLLNCSIDLFSQKSETNLINKYTTEQGLSSNAVYSILQDKKGLIWVATEEGLNKFDGKSFTVFSVNKGRYSLSHNRTQTLYLAPDGNIWTGTSNGLNIYNYKSDSIIQVTTKTSPLKLVYNDITFIASSFDKTKTWIGTYGNGVNFFDWSKERFHTLLLPKIRNVVPPKNVMSLLEDDNKRLWIGTRHNGLYRYDLQSKKLEIYDLPDNSQFIRVIYQDSYRRIWIGTSKGCYLYNETTNQLEIINYPAELKTTFIGVIKEDRNGKIWIGTELCLMNFSVRSFSLTEKFMYQVINHGESVSRLNCGSINALYADVDNNIWIGTAWGGVNMLKTTPTKFKLIRHDSEVKYSLPNSPINALCPDKHGNLFVATEGTDKIGVGLLNLQNSEFKELNINKRFPNVVYQCMYYDSHDNLWLGTYNNGLIKTNKEGTVYNQYFSDKQNLNTIPGNDIRCIFEAKDGTIWIGTSNGFAKFKSDNQQFERINLHVDMLGIRCIRETNDGTLWLGSYGEGLITYNYRTKKLNLNPVPFKVDIIYDVLIHNDNIWIATQGEGLVVFNRKSRKFRFYKETDGLPTNYLKTLSRDNNGRIWIASTRGLTKLEPKTNEIENFNSQDGLQNREFSERSFATLPNGLFAFGGFGGLNIFNPLDVKKNDKCPPVVFTKLLIYNEIITPTENRHNYSPIKENITLTDKIELKYNQSVFTIEFMGIDYNATQKIQYAYILEGSDKKWNHLGTQNSVTLRNLLPGKYIFKVKASSPDAVWNDANIASIIIIVKPPFWLTGWAYLFYLIIFTTLLYFIWSFLTIRIHTANHLKIERAKHEKEEELHQEKLQFFTNISHEFRTPLTLIIGPLEKMQMEETENDKKNQVKLMLRNAKRLLSMVNQLLDFRKAEKGQMKLKVRKQDLIKVVNDTVCLFDELKNQKNINFDFIHDDEQLFAWFDAEFLNKSLFNLLSNAFKFTADGGRIFIRLEVIKDLLDNNNVEISCTDNGKGIHPNDIQFVFDRFFLGKEQSSLQQGSGIGLHFAKNLIELHHGTIEVISTPNVETTFKITIPIESSAYLKDEFKDETELFTMASLNIPEDNFAIDIDKKLTLKKDTRKRILIVEDNSDIRNYIESILSVDYIVEDAENGVVALEMLEMNDFDLIVSDLMMPEMDGIELCKRLKSSIETDHIPFIMLTAKADIENRIEGLSIGADSYITKPFHPKHLTVRVAKLIELRDLLKERYSRKISLGELSITENNTTSPDELFMQKTISIILSKMIETDFNGDSLSNDLGISRMGLHRKIKALTDQSTGEFIRNIRLKKACELLSIPSKNISEVSYEVGFNSPSYFTTCFTETFKVTPSEYAKNMRNTIS